MLRSETLPVLAASIELISETIEDQLVFVDHHGPGFRRRRAGKGFAYYDLDNKPIRDPAVLKRIRSLAIPPAYTDVWISPLPHGHIQAIGRDARGRVQYRYHKRWTELAGAHKYDRVLRFARCLPRLRERIEADLRQPGLSRPRVLATVTRLLETTLIRVGNDEYAKANQSFGLTTLANEHVAVEGAKLRFEFKGKSGKMWNLAVSDRRIARIVRQCQELPGQRLFQYLDDQGQRQGVTSADVNAYLKEISGADITAKDFRTWAGTWRAAVALAALPEFHSATEAKRNIRKALTDVAAQLGNTPTVCRKGYVHPAVLDAYVAGELKWRAGRKAEAFGLSPEERGVLAFLAKKARAEGVGVEGVRVEGLDERKAAEAAE